MSTSLHVLVAMTLAANAAITDWEPLKDNQLYVGGDLHTTSRTSIDGCAVDCRAVTRCDRFVWTKKLGGTCYLKEFTTVTAPGQHGAMAGRLTSSSTSPSLPHSSASSTAPVEDHQVGQPPLAKLAFHTMHHAMWASAYPMDLFTVNLTDGGPLFRPPLLDSNEDNITPFHHVESVGECAQITSVFDMVFFTYLPTSRLCIPLQPPTPADKNPLTNVTATMIHLRWPSSHQSAENTATPLPLVLLSFLASFERATGSSESADACDAACASDPSCAASRWADNHCTMYSPHEAPAPVEAIAGWLAPPTTANLPVAYSSTAADDSVAFRPSSVRFFILAHPDDALLFMMDDVLAALMDPTTKIVFVCVTAGDAGQTDGWWEAREAGAVAALAFLVQTLTNSSISQAPHEVVVQRDGFPVTQVTVGPRVVHYFLRLSEAGWNDLVVEEEEPKPVTPTSPVLVPSVKSASGQGSMSATNPPTSNADSNDLVDPLQLGDVHAILRSILKTDAYGVANVSVGSQAWPPTPSKSDDEADHELHMATGKFVAEQVIGTVPLWKKCVDQRYYFGYQRWRHGETMAEPFRTYQRQAWMRMSKAVQDRYPIGYPPWLDHAHTLGRQYVDYSVTSTKPCHS